MERTVRILSQSPLATRQYMDRKTGEQKVMNSVTLKLTDGIDTFLGEITGERAVNCPKYDPQYVYRVQCSMTVREWNSQQTGEAMQATTIYVDKINMM
ncbi:MAG: hypothetical protein E7103_12130 [Prevotella sp.]|nr:hypothetical protein [Prevotella sp.]MBR2776858.1 hypothetical protein [Prevotella sp.]